MQLWCSFFLSVFLTFLRRDMSYELVDLTLDVSISVSLSAEFRHALGSALLQQQLKRLVRWSGVLVIRLNERTQLIASEDLLQPRGFRLVPNAAAEPPPISSKLLGT